MSVNVIKVKGSRVINLAAALQGTANAHIRVDTSSEMVETDNGDLSLEWKARVFDTTDKEELIAEATANTAVNALDALIIHARRMVMEEIDHCENQGEFLKIMLIGDNESLNA
jgi:hypothetical protein